MSTLFDDLVAKKYPEAIKLWEHFIWTSDEAARKRMLELISKGLALEEKSEVLRGLVEDHA